MNQNTLTATHEAADEVKAIVEALSPESGCSGSSKAPGPRRPRTSATKEVLGSTARYRLDHPRHDRGLVRPRPRQAAAGPSQLDGA